MKGLIIRID